MENQKIKFISSRRIAEVILGILFLGDYRVRSWLKKQSVNYIGFLAYGLIFTLLLVILGILISSPLISSLAIILSILILVIVSIPIQVGEAVADRTAFKTSFRRLIGWLAFIGWLGVIQNNWLSYRFIILGIFLFLIWAAFSSNSKSDKLVISFVTLVTVWTIMVWAFPVSNQAFNRYLRSENKELISRVNRHSLSNEARAGIVYARPNRALKHLYLFKIKEGKIVSVSQTVSVLIKTDSLLKIFNPSNRIKEFQNQGFIQIQVMEPNGLYGPPYWVQADYITIISPRVLAAKKTPQINVRVDLKRERPVKPVPVVRNYYPGDKPYFKLGAGQETGWLNIPANGLTRSDFLADGDFYFVPKKSKIIKVIFVKKGSNTHLPLGLFKLRAGKKPVLIEIDIN